MKREASVVAIGGFGLVVAVLSVSCIGRNYAHRYSSATVGVLDHEYVVTKGTSIVLELFKEKGVPIPDVFWGHTLFLEIDPQRVVVGNEVTIPGEGVRTFLSVLNAPMNRVTESSVGRIRFREVSERVITADLDIRSDELEWSYKGRVRFVTPSP